MNKTADTEWEKKKIESGALCVCVRACVLCLSAFGCFPFLYARAREKRKIERERESGDRRTRIMNFFPSLLSHEGARERKSSVAVKASFSFSSRNPDKDPMIAA